MRSSRPVRIVAAGSSCSGRAIGTALLVIGPWVVFNLTRFEKPELLSTQFGPLLAASNCDTVYQSVPLSYYSTSCTEAIRVRSIPDSMDQSQSDAVFRREGLHYISQHKGRAPQVVVARLASILGLYHPQLQLELEDFIDRRPIRFARPGLYAFYALALLSIAGAVVLRRRRTMPVFPLLVPPAITLATVAIGYSTTRFRAPAEVSVVVLGAIALEAGIRELRMRQLRRRQSVAPGERLELSTS